MSFLLVYATLWFLLGRLSCATECDFSGGWAKREQSSCGASLTQCGVGLQNRCCPTGSYCYGEDRGTGYCCPDNSDCYEDILNVPRVRELPLVIIARANLLII